MELLDVVNRLVGPVRPVGDSHIDLGRQTNLRALCDLTGELLDCIERVAKMPGEHMDSIAKSKRIAAEFLAERIAHDGAQRDDANLLRRAPHYLEAAEIAKFGPKGLEEVVAAGDHPVVADLRKRLAPADGVETDAKGST